MPVLIGWAAVTGSLAWPAVVLFGVVFFWTPPHFWALAIRYREDYSAAGVPMLPVVASPLRVAREITIYSWLTALCSLALWPLATSWVYGVLADHVTTSLVKGDRVTVRADDVSCRAWTDDSPERKPRAQVELKAYDVAASMRFETLLTAKAARQDNTPAGAAPAGSAPAEADPWADGGQVSQGREIPEVLAGVTR